MYGINANIEMLTLAQRDSFVDIVQSLGANKLESMNIRENIVNNSNTTFCISANLKLLTSQNVQAVMTNITASGSEKIITLNIRKV